MVLGRGTYSTRRGPEGHLHVYIYDHDLESIDEVTDHPISALSSASTSMSASASARVLMFQQ
jgi:hypothetical protein